MRPYIITLAVAVSGISAAAQDLHTEITVDRNVQPELREASRPNGVTPALLQPKVELKNPSQAEYTGAGALTPDVSILPAATWRDSVEHSPYRGYAMVGYLPMYNAGANVGYRFIDTPRYGLGLWAQYDGISYKGDIPYYDGAKFTDHTLTVGGNGTARFGALSLLSADGSITLGSVSHPYFIQVYGEGQCNSYKQTYKDMRASLSWQSRVNDVVYDMRGTLGYFDLGEDADQLIVDKQESVRQALVEAGGSVGLADEGTSVPWLAVEGTLRAMRSTDLPYTVNGYYTNYACENLWLATLRPYLRFDNDVLEGLVGLNLSVSKGYRAKSRIAPEAQLTYRPAKAFVMYAKVSGGQHMNLMRDIFDINPYIDTKSAYSNTHIPISVTGGLRVGPYDGMSLGLCGGYAKVKDGLTPLITIMHDGLMESRFSYSDYNSWYFGADMSYAYRRWFVLSGGIKCGGADTDVNSWHEWTDGAKVVANVGLRVTPLPQLELHVDYDMRYDRKARSVIYSYAPSISQKYTGIPNLGTINSVNVGGSYQLSPQVTAFVEVDNVLNERYKLISGMPSAGVHGLLGVACKF